MALFKIAKGNVENINNTIPTAVEGFCYFNLFDKKFYIDTKSGSLNGSNPTGERVALNANIADYSVRAGFDINGNPLIPTNFSRGDLIYGNDSPLGDIKFDRLPAGLENQILEMSYNNGHLIPQWKNNILYTGLTLNQYETAPIQGTYDWNGLNITSSDTAQYGTLLSLGSQNPAQLLITSSTLVGQDGSEYPHAFIRRSGSSWTNWSKILDNNNYTNYTVTKTGYGATGTWSIDINGTAAVASKLGNIDIGTTIKPIYLDKGIPVAFSENIGTATKPIYLDEGTITQCDDTLDVNITGTAATATGVSLTQATVDNLNRYVFFAETGTTATKASLAFDTDFYYDSGSNTLHVPNLTGNAATATQATNAINANNATQAERVEHNLQVFVGGVYQGNYNGSEDTIIDVNASNLGLNQHMAFLGVVENIPTGSTVTLTGGTTKVAEAGDIVLLNKSGDPNDGKQFVYTSNGRWEPMGTSSDFALTGHKHGNIDSEGKLIKGTGFAESEIVSTDSTGTIQGSGKTFGSKTGNVPLLGSDLGTTAGKAIVTSANGTLVVSNALGSAAFTEASAYKAKQTSKSDPTSSGSAIDFIATITQNANGEITATKKAVREASASQSGVVNTGTQTFAGNKTFSGSTTTISGLGVTSTSTIPGTQAFVRTTADNPLFGLSCGGTNYYLQATSNGLYLGPTSSRATSWDQSGNMTTRGNIAPGANESHDIGSQNNKYNNIYAKTFIGNLTGNATTATTANKVTNSLVIGTKTYNGSSEVTITSADLGLDGNYKTVQTAVSSPSTSGSTTAFIDSISQDTNGVITATKKTLDTTGTWSGTAVTATTAGKVKYALTFGNVNNPLYTYDGSEAINIPIYDGTYT